MICFFLILQVQWESINRPYDSLRHELVINFSIEQHRIQFISEDSVFYAEYETQLKVYDDNGDQVAGDFWEHYVIKNTDDIRDSVKLLIPRNSQYFDLKIVDLHGGNVFAITENIVPITYIGNIQRLTANDTLYLVFTILNRDGKVDSLHVSVKDIEGAIRVEPGLYDDTLVFPIATLKSDEYTVLFELYSDDEKIEELNVPLTVTRAFYLDDRIWALKVAQLVYIATPSEMDVLENAQVEERDSLWTLFWHQHDPSPTTEFNEMEEEYFERIAYCEENFSHGDKGWRSDRAKVYVRYGSPDEIQRKPYQLHAEFPDPYGNRSHLYDAYEIWFYYRANRQFVFADRYGLGEYILLNPNTIDL